MDSERQAFLLAEKNSGERCERIMRRFAERRSEAIWCLIVSFALPWAGITLVTNDDSADDRDAEYVVTCIGDSAQETVVASYRALSSRDGKRPSNLYWHSRGAQASSRLTVMTSASPHSRHPAFERVVSTCL